MRPKLARHGIDQALKKVVAELNLRGITTKYSCEGHRGRGDVVGYITFKGKLSKEELDHAKEVLHHHGILRTTARTRTMKHGPATTVEFAPRSQ